MGVGGFGFLGVLANRTFSDLAPVVDASSSQSRADVLAIVMSAILFLTCEHYLLLYMHYADMQVEGFNGRVVFY
jgi:hypothetical protein